MDRHVVCSTILLLLVVSIRCSCSHPLLAVICVFVLGNFQLLCILLQALSREQMLEDISLFEELCYCFDCRVHE
jgi:hypothetical protein